MVLLSSRERLLIRFICFSLRLENDRRHSPSHFTAQMGLADVG